MIAMHFSAHDIDTLLADIRRFLHRYDSHRETVLLPIDVLNPTVRTANCFERAGIKTIGDLLRYTDNALRGLLNFGRSSLHEIKIKLAELGLTLPKDIKRAGKED